jgi:hypothetical protein
MQRRLCPPAKTDQCSPIYGLPILEVDKARTVMVIKRSMSPGFAGIDNPFYYLDKTLMLFGDAKGFVGEIVRELTGGHWEFSIVDFLGCRGRARPTLAGQWPARRGRQAVPLHRCTERDVCVNHGFSIDCSYRDKQ